MLVVYVSWFLLKSRFSLTIFSNMPQPRWYHKSLSELCMDSIVNNMEKWTESRSSVHVSSLFNLLPSHYLEYMNLELVKRNQRELLLNPHLKTLDLSKRKNITESLQIVRLASVRCSQLTSLKMGFFNKLPSNQVEDTFTPMLQLFEHLQILDLSGTIYDGASCMINLGSTDKPKLREFRIDLCPGVTDSVMQVFCNGQSSLQKLSVNRTEVTHIGIRFAIEHLPELKELYCDNKSDILKAFRRIFKETRESKKYSLIKCWLMWPPPDEAHMWPPPDEVSYKKGSVSLMVDMCPSLVDVFIDVRDEGFTNEELLGFRELKQLKTLGIWNTIQPTIISIRPGVIPPLTYRSVISIRDGVIPLLQAHGHTLERLFLSMPITSEELCRIIESCPNIRCLKLLIRGTLWDTPEPVVDDGVHSSHCSAKEVIPLRMLEVISLSCYFFQFAISRKSLLLLLSSPALTKISIKHCFTLDDQIIEEACASNSFKYLTKLKFRGCSNVSQKVIDFFLNEANPLSDIYLKGCGNVNPKRLKRMRTMAQEKHWNSVKITVEDDDDDN